MDNVGGLTLAQALVDAGLAESTSAANRLIAQGAVKLSVGKGQPVRVHLGQTAEESPYDARAHQAMYPSF